VCEIPNGRFVEAKQENQWLDVRLLWSNPDGGFGSAAPVRDSKMQPFTFDFLRVGICDPRMTAIARLHFQTLLGERPFTGVDRSLARKSASDAFGSNQVNEGSNGAAGQRS
jgi:hypothetical protein